MLNDLTERNIFRKLDNINQDDIKKVFHFNAKEKEMMKHLNLNYAIINIKYIYQR